MRKEYLIRLDDACPTMDVSKWQKMEDILDRAGVCPMVGVIPHNEDPGQQLDKEDDFFWDKVQEWERKGWTIALHGYNHCYSSDNGLEGLNPLWERSEFAGLPIDRQREKIRGGVAVFREHGINPKFFFAPSHTFDKNTLYALKEESDIRIISDTVAIKPYSKYGFTFIPQLGGHCREMRLPGFWTFCLHPSAMSEADFAATEKFLSQHKNEFLSFGDIQFEGLKSKDVFSRVLSIAYFAHRRFKGVK